MQGEYHGYNLDKGKEHRRHGACCCHIEENTQDVYGQQGHNCFCDNELYYIAEVGEELFQSGGGVGEHGAAEAEDECEHERAHHGHERLYGDSEEGAGRRTGGIGGGACGHTSLDKGGEDSGGSEIGEHA